MSGTPFPTVLSFLPLLPESVRTYGRTLTSLNFIRLVRVVFSTQQVITTRSNRMKFRLYADVITNFLPSIGFHFLLGMGIRYYFKLPTNRKIRSIFSVTICKRGKPTIVRARSGSTQHKLQNHSCDLRLFSGFHHLQSKQSSTN